MSANGYLAPSELTDIGDGLSLRTDAAKSFLAMAAAAQADDVQINWPGKASAYRPWAMQLDMRVHPALYGINPNMHALPGLPSSHGTGLAKDVPFGAPNDWMIANAARFGWTRPARTLKLNDLNHWEFTPGTATASLDITPVQEDTMAHAVVVQAQTDPHFNWIAVVTENGQLHEVDPKNRPWWNDLAACYDPVLTAKPVTEQQYITFVAANQPATSAQYPPIDYAAIATAVNSDAAARLAH